jgi:hypothetical protein
MKNLKLYSGVTKESWDNFWKDKKLSDKETNVTSDINFAYDYSYNFKTGKYEDLVIEISNIPLEAFSAVRDEDYEDDNDFESLNNINDDKKIKIIESNSLFLLNLKPYKDIIKINLIDKNIELKNDPIVKTINKLNQSDNTKAFMQEFDVEFNKSEFRHFTEVRLLIEKDKIEVDTIWTHSNLNEGHGSAALKLITHLADKYKIDLTLSSSPLRYSPDDCTDEEHINNDKFLDNESLINFYKKNGFKIDDKFLQGNIENPEQPRMIRSHSVKPTLKIKP